jgi:hypothetical protein
MEFLHIEGLDKTRIDMVLEGLYKGMHFVIEQEVSVKFRMVVMIEILMVMALLTSTGERRGRMGYHLEAAKKTAR